MQRFYTGWLTCVLLVAATACDNDSPAVIGEQRVALSQYGDYTLWPENMYVGEPELSFDKISLTVPEFAGFYYDDQGDLAIRVTDLDASGAATAIVSTMPIAHQSRGVAVRPPPGAGGGVESPPLPRLRTELAEFAWSDLHQWWATVRRPVMNIDGVVFTNIGIAANRIRVGVVDETAQAAARDLLDQAGVPDGAVQFDLAHYARPEIQTLTDPIIPRIGGIQGFVVGRGACTIGFVGRNSSGVNGFFGASHCSPEKFSVDSSILYQPTTADTPLGIETEDPSWFICGLIYICRNSDTSFWARAEGVNSSEGRIARPISYNSGAPGTLYIWDPSDEYFRVVSERSPTEGLILDKVGRKSGWTYGEITSTCTDTNFSDNTRIICMIKSNTYSDGGDSGSPVFYWDGTDHVQLMGMLTGGPVGNLITYSTRISGIRQDFGNIRTY